MDSLAGNYDVANNIDDPANPCFYYVEGCTSSSLSKACSSCTACFQKAFAFTPTWMMEGGAELLACHLGEQHGWGERDQTMRWYAESLENAGELRYSLRDMEEIETAGPLIARWHRELAYEAGAWAVAYIISRSLDKGIRTYYQTFYPLAHTKGWQAALCEYTGAKSVDAFYEDFQSFITQPLDERVILLTTLKV